MAERKIRRIVLSLLALAIAVSVNVADAQSKGRYKKDGSTCVWDANDSGPNQCAAR